MENTILWRLHRLATSSNSLLLGCWVTISRMTLLGLRSLITTRSWLWTKKWKTMPRTQGESRVSTRLVMMQHRCQLRLRSQLNKSPPPSWTLSKKLCSIGVSLNIQRSVRLKPQKRLKRNTSVCPKYSGFLNLLRTDYYFPQMVAHSASQKKPPNEKSFASSPFLRQPIEKKTLNFVSYS